MNRTLPDNIADLLVWTEDGHPIVSPGQVLYRVWIDPPPHQHRTITEGRPSWTGWWEDADKGADHYTSNYRYFADRAAAEAFVNKR